METPAALPPSKPPLGARFYILLLTPLVLTALAFCCINVRNLAAPLLLIAGLSALVCSILLAGQLARRFSNTGEASAGMCILMFFALQAFYGVCFFIGCTATIAVS